LIRLPGSSLQRDRGGADFLPNRHTLEEPGFMRVEELAYAVNGQPVTVQFHARLTVVHVNGAGERAAWAARVLGVLEGVRPGDGASVVCVDGTGRRVRLARDDQGGATLTDLATGAELPYAAGHLSLDGRFDWFASVGLRSRAAADLILVDAAAFTGDEQHDGGAVTAELSEARAGLAEVEGRRQAAISRLRRADELRGRIADLDEQIRRADAVDDTRRAFSTRSRLDRDAQARALARPTEVPADLETLAGTCRATAQRRDELVARLDAREVHLPPVRETPQATMAEEEAALHRELVEEVEPAFVDALAVLADACRPFGVTIDAADIEAAGVDAAGIEAVANRAVAEVVARAAEAGDARLQQALEVVESDPRTRVSDPRSLAAERSRLLRRLQRAERDLPDAAELAERHGALERRIAALGVSFRASGPLPAVSAAESVLLGRAARVCRVGRYKEQLPLVVDEAFAAFGVSDKSPLLDLLVGLGETTQIVYLTDDPDTLAWASEKARTGQVGLLGPDGSPTVASQAAAQPPKPGSTRAEGSGWQADGPVGAR
jgi:hypothetical protein